MIFNNDSLGLYSIDIKYEGSTSATQYCIDDFMRRLYGSRKIVDMTILTCENYHALMLCFEDQDLVVFIKSGLTSGYPGEGPKGTSLIIRLAEEAGITIKELNVAPTLFKRINSSLVTVKDVEFIKRNGRESLNYDRLCLKIVDKEYVQRAKDSFKKNKDIIFVRAEDEKTKDSVEIDRAKALKMLQDLQQKVNQINENSRKSDIITTLGNISSIASYLKSFIGL
ncbi:hypothetical protein SAMN05720766_1032 [Fibrobacter sp. UWH9]|uniref:hypothetical protein n=1 Tax=Fibrobacter sp. UWH9 TaxID=1896213 RepID=UPI0009121870|nr:hypothetical protein [Fibrobacter sp. UWH9]SHG60999.1 hypothetical protein SAMN05720766_1032 [Fibrobacter sp. UWH9]